MNIAALLSDPNREWRGRPPADEARIADFVKLVQISLPVEYIELLRVTNGGEGELALPPLWLQLYSVEECTELIHDPPMEGCLQAPQSSGDRAPADFFVFAGNGGLECIAFDLRTGPPLPVVMIDPVAGPESAKQIAPDFETFIQAIGITAE
jgi:hypothetical protein